MGTSTEFYGKDRLSWVSETSFGSGGNMATNGEILGYDAEISNITLEKGPNKILSAGADNRQIQGYYAGREKTTFTLEWTPVNWRVFKYMLDVSNGDDGGIKTHTFTEADTINSFILEWVKTKTASQVFA